jgi:protoheme IX farnesyltransferase
LNGIASIGGYMLFPGEKTVAAACALFAGVSLLAAAGSVLNQVMERDLDGLMRRTQDRPLPAGELSALAAVAIGLLCALAGGLLLLYGGNPLPALIGLQALGWYLAIYTPMKRRSPFALLLGAVAGAAPPVIGWCMASGSPLDFRILLLAGVLYLWQVPHFWLLQRRHADDYRRAGIPLFTPSGKETGQPLICMVWITAMLASAMMLPAFGIVGGNPVIWCATFCIPLIVTAIRATEPAVFTCVNLFPLFVTVAVCAGR